jgi:hypothetical protein
MAFDSKEYGWVDIQIVFAGRPIVGCTEIKYKEKADREFIYGLGKQPVAYADGMQEVDGNITLLQSEFEALVRSLPAGKTPTSLAPFDIIIAYIDDTSLSVKDIVKSVLLTEYEKGGKKGDLNMEISLPFKAAAVQLNAK